MVDDNGKGKKKINPSESKTIDILDRVQSNISTYFENFTGHNMKCLSSFNRLVEFMHLPTDAAAIGIGRFLFGLMMLFDIPEERSGNDLDYRWGEPRDCRFPLLPFLTPLSLPKMGLVYAVMWLGALGITLGYRYRISCLMFVFPYWYIFLLDKSSWNNHSYLFGLISVIFLFSNAHHYFSIDAWKHNLPAKVPFWNYFLLKYQFFILYTFAGLKKFSVEWLSGYSMTNLSYHWVFVPFRIVLGAELTDLLIVHWFAAIFDLTIAFWLIYDKTRPIATLFCSAFHLMNSRIFRIGVFPWVCLLQLPLFYHVSWPRILWRKLKYYKFVESLKDLEVDTKSLNRKPLENSNPKRSKSRKFTVTMILSYCCLQLFLPYSHFITQGYNNWVNGIYGYSWDMMINAWETVLISVKVVDHGDEKVHFLEPMAFTETDRWTKYPDMAVQYAQCINKNLQWEFKNNKNTVLKSDNFSIYFDIWCSLNGRFQQRIYNPTIDLLKTDWHPLKKPKFTLPLLREYSKFRTTMTEISNDVLSWSNYTDLIFIADFPGLSLDNFIVAEFENVTLTVLEGAVKFQLDNETKSSSLSKGQSISVKSGVFHKVTTISSIPSCYMYTYVNATRQMLEIPPEEIDIHSYFPFERKPTASSITNEISIRVENYKKFFIHIANSFLFEFYNVPMPRRIRELQAA